MINRVRMPRFAKQKKHVERLESVHSYSFISLFFLPENQGVFSLVWFEGYVVDLDDTGYPFAPGHERS